MARINLDVDGVVADTTPGLFSSLKQAGFDPLPPDDPSWRTWYIMDRMTPDMRTEALKTFNEPSFWRNLPTVPGAKEAVQAFREAGHHIQWVTTPWEQCYGWREERRDWLKEQFEYPSQKLELDLTVGGSKAEIWADVYIDDKPEHVRGWTEKWGDKNHLGLLYRNNFNHECQKDYKTIVWSSTNIELVLTWLKERYPQRIP